MQGSFWSAFGVRFGAGSSGIDEVLEKENCQIEDILEHDDVIQECKYMNAPLIEFLSTKESVEKLIRHVIAKPSPEDEKTKASKSEDDKSSSTSSSSSSSTEDKSSDETKDNSASSSSSETDGSSDNNADTTIKRSSTSENDNDTPRSTATDDHDSDNDGEGDEEKKRNNAYKYPYIASELFACEVVSMLDILFEHEELLDLLFSFLDQPAPIDPSNAAYFRKVVVVLIQRKYDALVKYIQSKKIIDKMVEHIGLYSVMELLIMIGWDDGLGQVQDTDWLFHQSLVPKLVAKLAPEFEYLPDVHMNAARALVDVVVKCPPSTSSKLVSHLQSTSILKTIFQHTFSGSQSSLTNTLSIIIVLVQRYATRRAELGEERGPDGDLDDHDKETNDSSSTTTSSTSGVGEDQTEEPFTSLLPHLKSIMDLLLIPPVEQAKTQFGPAKPFGETRMKVVELVLVLLRSHVIAVDKELVRLKVLPSLIDAFFDYPWNNMLHGLVESIIRTVLDSDSSLLKSSLFQEGKLVDKFIAAYDRSEEVSAKRGASDGGANKGEGYRLGYMGHLIRTSQAIEEICSKHDNIRLSLLGESSDRWTDFIRTKMEKENERQKAGAPFGEDDMMDGMQLDMNSLGGGGQYMGGNDKDNGQEEGDDYGFHEDDNDNTINRLSRHEYEYNHQDHEGDGSAWSTSAYDDFHQFASHTAPFGHHNEEEDSDEHSDSDDHNNNNSNDNDRSNPSSTGAHHTLVSFSMSGLDDDPSHRQGGNHPTGSGDDFDPRNFAASGSSSNNAAASSNNNNEFEKDFDPFSGPPPQPPAGSPALVAAAAAAAAAATPSSTGTNDDFVANFPPPQ